ncbi:hypothetical protein GUJ93_ZPchr0007g4876 [Zizania palustris]|uniref:Auxin-responsive protein n=1 Tax=Zizania palustris TaxID=103762 RepID=A0A8J5T6L0_ZIZPA|nr:hypothetical protein GUJ93_ZPchr0007g4876 [Zizania palustris]
MDNTADGPRSWQRRHLLPLFSATSSATRSSSSGSTWMFVESCKRLRIMKGSEVIGIAPGSNGEMCKSRS